ncbi:MAG: OprO/OprP family phosphate-selective porin [Prevotella sp.]|nr:OprO/OprP family phosphate-selective porin [Prevotella sp.]
MNTKKIVFVALALCACCFANGQDEKKVDLTPNIHGTLRGKYEYQTQEKEGRFEVRTARVSVDGYVAKNVSYKAEIDLCDEGNIKMLDAYTKFGPFKGFDITIGQMRVPFTIDVIRSPHQQYFANRSFIAKQVANVRDVGASIGYSFNVGFPIIIQLGMFNGSGLTNQKDFWTNNINFTAKAQFMLPRGFNVTLSTQKIKPDNIDIMMYDAGAFYQAHGWHIEAEYLYKHYAQNAFKNVHAVDAFINYDIPLRKCIFSKISPLIRYDFMSDHSDGIRYLDGEENTAGSLIVNDSKRSRITGGVTFSISKPFISDIRLNYEKYFYGHDGIAKTSERDKIVLEVMTRF